jgi:2-phospho-L-lactate transferase/gluconeogenesis factor (CofD/UPF0052 family)
MAAMRITLVVGADGAPFVHDLAARLEADDELTVIAPTVRGHFSAGLRASPDLDGLLSTGTGTYSVAESLESLGYVPRWQRTSDQETAVRLIRTDLVTSGASLTDATIAAATRSALPYRLLPVSDDRAEFRVVVGTDEPRAIHVGEYLDDPETHEAAQLLLIAEGITVSSSASQAVRDSDLLVLGPSSRTLVIDPVLRTPGFLDLIPDELPVLVVDHAETAPADLVRVAGLSQPDPGRSEPVPNDAEAVYARAHQLVGS